MRIDSSGNVGINEDSPDTILHIQQPSNDRAGGIYSQVNGGSYGISMFVNSGGYGIIGGNGTYPNDVISMDFNNAYVGIGISPQFKLHVIGASATEATVARFAKGNFADTGGHTTIIGLGTENTATWTKAALAFERTSSYDTGKIHFLQDNTFDTSTATLSDSVMTIDRTGNVSIGATTINGSFGTSNTILAVKGSSSGGEGILQLTGLANNATDIAGRIEFHSQAEADPMCSIRAIRGSADDIGSLSFLVNNGGSPDTKMTIASDGDIIASQDTDITARFGRAHIGYVGHADHAGFSHLDRDNAFDYALLQDSGGDTYVNAASGKQVHLRINNQNALEISQYEYMKASGRNHSPTYGSGYTFHSIEADEANEPTLMVFNDTTNESYGINVIANVDRNNTTSRFFMGQGGSTERIKIYSNGNIQNSNNSYGQLSDRKLKENIEDATPKLDDLMQVQIKNFNYIGEDNKQIGVIAQELEEIFPALVYETPDTERQDINKTDEEGNIIYQTEEVLVTEAVEGQKAIEWEDKPTMDNTKVEIQTWLDDNSIDWQSADTKQELLDRIPEYQQEAVEAQDAVYETRETDEPETVNKEVDLGTTTKAVKYSVFVPIMIKAMQEQQQIIEDLKARIENLEN